MKGISAEPNQNPMASKIMNIASDSVSAKDENESELFSSSTKYQLQSKHELKSPVQNIKNVKISDGVTIKAREVEQPKSILTSIAGG